MFKLLMAVLASWVSASGITQQAIKPADVVEFRTEILEKIKDGAAKTAIASNLDEFKSSLTDTDDNRAMTHYTVEINLFIDIVKCEEIPKNQEFPAKLKSDLKVKLGKLLENQSTSGMNDGCKEKYQKVKEELDKTTTDMEELDKAHTWTVNNCLKKPEKMWIG